MENLGTHTDLIRKYLLNRLDDRTRDEISEKILSDPEFFEMTSLIEQEIFDDFAAQRLSEEDKKRVQLIYGKNPAKREDSNFAQALFHVAQKISNNSQNDDSAEDTELQIAPIEIIKPKKSFFNPWLWQWKSIVAGLILLITVLVFYLYNQTNSTEKELARLNQKDVQQRSAQEFNENEPQFEGKFVIDITLESNPVRTITDSTPKVAINGNVSLVRFKLGLPNSTASSYEAIFKNDKGENLFSVPNLEPQNGFIYILVPSAFFQTADLQIILEARNKDGILNGSENYSFRVLKK